MKAPNSYLFVGAAFLITLFSVALFDAKENKDQSYQYAYLQTKEPYENAFAAAGPTIQTSAQIFVTPHHLLPAHLIARVVGHAETTQPRTVVLISPDHFNHAIAPVVVSQGIWITPFGELKPESDKVRQLIDSGVVTLDELAFSEEHGISNIVGFIHYAMPDARIVPLIVREDAPQETIEALVKSLAKDMEDTVFIGSFDFSHLVVPEVAVAQDAISISVLKSQDVGRINEVAIDSRKGLTVVLRLAKEVEATQFTLLGNTNSSLLINNPTQADTTSYVAGYFSGFE